MEQADFPDVNAHCTVPIASSAHADSSLCPGCGVKMRRVPKARSGTFVPNCAGNRYVCDNAVCPAKRPNPPTRRKP